MVSPEALDKTQSLLGFLSDYPLIMSGQEMFTKVPVQMVTRYDLPWIHPLSISLLWIP